MLLLLSGVILVLLRKTGLAKERTMKNPKVDVDHTGNRSPRPDKVNSTGREILGVSRDGFSDVYLAQGDTPETNMRHIIRMLGGISAIVGRNDIVVLKPNAQWWSQGTTNTDAMHAFIEAVLNIPGFRGEVIIAENHQHANENSRGWNTEKRNGRFNLNELVASFNARGNRNVSKYHWRCAGPNPSPRQGDASSASKIVKGPWEGDGYVWDQTLVYTSPLGRKCILSYPIFTSSYSGVTIDFKNGAWYRGRYTGQPLKFINFSALNHHSEYCGVTASVKNYMGIVDMTCGYQGTTPEGFWNAHFIGIRDNVTIPLFKYLPWRIRAKVDSLYKMKYFHHTAGVLGSIMRDVRMADLNIITAHWVGYGSRIDTHLSGYAKTVLASRDPVALDYIAGKTVLSPLTKEHAPNKAWLNQINDVTNTDGPFHTFLATCHQEGIGNLSPDKIRVIS